MNEETKKLRQGVKNMTKKEKASYIWEYYKLHIIFSLVGIIFVVSIVTTIVNRKEELLHVVFLKSISTEAMDSFESEASKQLISNPKKQELTIEFFSLNMAGTDEFNTSAIQKMSVLLGTNSLDLIISSKSVFESYASQGVYKALENEPYLNELKALGYDIVSAKDNEKNTKLYGINLANCSKLKDFNINNQDLVLGITFSPKNYDKAVEFIKWLLE